MSDASLSDARMSGTRVALDIGSTVVKVARIGSGDEIVSQEFYPRDFDAGVAKQVEHLFQQLNSLPESNDILICSSANGGLRVGIACLTERYSGAVLRNQVLSAGANPIFVNHIDDQAGHMNYVDILLVAGGIDCEDAPLLENKINNFKTVNYKFGSLLYAGNKYYSTLFSERFPDSVVIPNPLGATLVDGPNSVFESLRRAYLDDLVYKEGVSDLAHDLSIKIRPTPEVVNKGFQRILSNRSTIKVSGASLLFDVGGATTDLHYTVEIIRDDSAERPTAGSSIARYVFTDLGIVASLDSTLLQLRTHPRSYEFLDMVLTEDVRDTYQLLREGDYIPAPEVLSYACLFLSLDRFSKGKGPGLPVADLNKVSQIILTGGATQNLDEKVVADILSMFFAGTGNNPGVLVDREYQVWIDGITWSEGNID